jgi:hypothetical protein
MSSISTLAQRLLNIDWQWSRSWWEAMAIKLALTEKESVGSRKTYVDTEGELWDVYIKNDAVIFLEINFDCFVDTDSLSDIAYEDKVDEYFQKFEAAVSDIKATIGNPKFSDGAAARGFPDDQDANWLALWEGRNARLMLQQKHEARDLPFRICLVVAQQ